MARLTLDQAVNARVQRYIRDAQRPEQRGRVVVDGFYSAVPCN